MKLTFTCNHCDGAGTVGEDKLSRLQRRIIATLQGQHLNGVEESALIEAAYRDQKKGLPFYPLLTLQAAIRELNRRMEGREIVMKVNKYSSANRRRYHLLRTTEGEHHADGTDHRTVSRRPVGRAAHGEPAAREEK